MHYLGTDEKSLNPLRGDLNSANAIEDTNDELDILQGQADVVWSQLLQNKVFWFLILSAEQVGC